MLLHSSLKEERILQVRHKKLIKFIGLLLAVILVVSSVSACGNTTDAEVNEDQTQNDAADINQPIEQGTTAQADDKFTLRYSDDDTLNPFNCENVHNDAVVSLIYESLFRLSDEFEPINVLCKDYFTEDGIVYTFNIIETKLHDGSVLTADDVAYSITQARFSSKYAARLANVSYCAATEDNSVYMELYEADYSIPAVLDVPIVKYGTAGNDNPVGTGPYYFNRIGGRAGLSAFKEYRNRENITLDRIHLTEFSDVAVEESFANYTLDCIWQDTAGEKPVNLYSDHEARYYDTSILQYIGFNSETPVLNDPNMRLAVSYATNRSAIVEEIYNGYGVAANMVLHPEHYLYSDKWEEGFGYSSAKVSACLAASGLDDKNSDGFLEYPVNGEHQYFELKFVVYNGNDKKLKVAESIVENLQRVGLKVILTALPWDEYRAALNNGEFDLYYAEVAITRDFDFGIMLKPEGALDFGKMGDEAYKVLCEAFLKAVTIEDKKVAAENLCKGIAATAPIVPVMYRQYVVYTHRGVISNFSPTVSGVFSDVADWTVRIDGEN